MLRRVFAAWTTSIWLAFLLLSLAHPSHAQKGVPDTVRSSFILGAEFGDATRLHLIHPRLDGSGRRLFDEAMKGAASVAQQLRVPFDASAVPIDAVGSGAAGIIGGAMNNRATATSAAIDARHGSIAMTAFMLGFRAAVVTEYVPALPAAEQGEALDGLLAMARRLGLADAIVRRYASALRSTDRRIQVDGSMQFRRDVLAQFEVSNQTGAEHARQLLNIWLSGKGLSMAALGRAYGADPASTERLFIEARERARALDIRLPALPESDTKSPRDIAQVLHYLMGEVGERVADDVRLRLGERYAALFELAVKMSVAIILYGPEPGEGNVNSALISAIERTATTSRLPSELWRAVPQRMSERRPSEEVKAAIQASFERVEAYYRRLAGD
jgi:hypothetical protein